MNSTLLIDWLSLTYPSGKAIEHFPELMGAAEELSEYAHHIAKGDADFTVRGARHGYKYVAQNGEGISVLWNGTGSKQGLHITYPGRALAERETLALLGWHLERGARCTRLDIAIDAHTREMTVGQLALMRKAGICDTQSRKYSHIDSSTGETLYIGSRTSEQFLRIYDKGAQMGETQNEWMRIELEIKGDKAEWATSRLVEDGLSIIPSIILGFINFPECEKWAEIFQNHHKLRGNKKVSAPDTDKWILYTLLPTIARRFVENPRLQAQFSLNLGRHMAMIRGLQPGDSVEIG